MQLIFSAYFWGLEQQVLFSKVLASQTTAPDTELFAITLSIFKATNMDIECIILITNFLSSARKVVDPSVHSGQTHSLAICFVLRLFFSCSLNHRIKFWTAQAMISSLYTN